MREVPSGAAPGLSARINPKVLEQRQAAIEKWASDEALDQVRRRQLAEIIATHLLEDQPR